MKSIADIFENYRQNLPKDRGRIKIGLYKDKPVDHKLVISLCNWEDYEVWRDYFLKKIEIIQSKIGFSLTAGFHHQKSNNAVALFDVEAKDYPEIEIDDNIRNDVIHSFRFSEEYP